MRENILHKYVNPVYISLFVYQNGRYHVKSSFSPFFLQKSYLFMQIVRIWIRQGRCEDSLFEIAYLVRGPTSLASLNNVHVVLSV